MGQLSLLASVAVLAFFSFGFLKNIGHWFKKAPELPDRARMEQQLKKEGLMKADGKVSVDADFDAELNAEIKEMNSIDADTEKDLQALEAEQQ